VEDIAEKLAGYGIDNSDIIVVDVFSNSCIKGSDDDGNLIPPFKDHGTGKWHVPGDLVPTPKPALKNIASLCSEKWFKHRKPKLIGIVPLPRYVTDKCCDDPGHVRNIADPDYISDLENGLESIEDLALAWVQSINERSVVFNFRSCTDDPEDPLPDLQVGGRPLWSAADPVHGIPELYSLASSAIMSAIETDTELENEDGQPAQKRQRLESVIVRRAGKSRPRGRGTTASWSTGTLPPTRGKGGKGAKGRGRAMRGRFMRGAWRGGHWPPRSHRGGLY
jgi:hypothetical protein